MFNRNSKLILVTASSNREHLRGKYHFTVDRLRNVPLYSTKLSAHF